jgi:hypothetical protein
MFGMNDNQLDLDLLKENFKNFVLVSTEQNNSKLEIAIPFKTADNMNTQIYFNSDYIRHTLLRHGIGKEKQAEQIPLSIQDLIDIPEIINKVDNIYLEKNNVVFIKNVNGFVYIITIINRNNVLRFKTMYKRKRLKNNPAFDMLNDNSLSSTSENVLYTSDNDYNEYNENLL